MKEECIPIPTVKWYEIAKVLKYKLISHTA
jgi:hypothetical protein